MIYFGEGELIIKFDIDTTADSEEEAKNNIILDLIDEYSLHHLDINKDFNVKVTIGEYKED